MPHRQRCRQSSPCGQVSARIGRRISRSSSTTNALRGGLAVNHPWIRVHPSASRPKGGPGSHRWRGWLNVVSLLLGVRVCVLCMVMRKQDPPPRRARIAKCIRWLRTTARRFEAHRLCRVRLWCKRSESLLGDPWRITRAAVYHFNQGCAQFL